MRVPVSTLNFGLKPLSQLSAVMASRQFPEIEISSGHPYEPGVPELLEEFARGGAKLLIHNYAPPAPDDPLINLSDPRPAARARVVDFLKGSISLTKRLGADYYSFHAGYRVPYEFGRKQYSDTERMPHEEALRLFIETLKPIVAYGESLGVRIGVENHVVAPGNEDNLILFGADEFAALFEGVPSAWLSLHLDVGHLTVSAKTMGFDRAAFVASFRDRIVGLHAHDNDGSADQHRPFGPDWWFLEHVPSLSALTYCCLETKTAGNSGEIRRMTRLIQERAVAPAAQPAAA
jgi:sugar phosphate isomerase/epimerase